MPSLKAIRKRIASVKNTQKITKAMKMVAAAKLRRAQEAVVAMRPYAARMKQLACELAERAGEPEGSEEAELMRLLRGGPVQRIRLVAVTSDRGLAGAFNSNIIRRTERFLVEEAPREVSIAVVGKKGRDALRRRKNVHLVAELAGAEPKTAAERARELAAQLSADLLAGQMDAVYVAYNEFKNAGSQLVRLERLLPIAQPSPVEGEPPDEPPRTFIDYEYEPTRLEVLRQLLPLYIETELHRIFLESIASEFGARMSAMDNASRNAKEMISRLTLQYNRARQAAITKELMEIVSGAEALKG
ncbi:MAG: ATP synthase F1 subunit gamma [Myxococcales bacterium]|nr:ATP synthase F1 subunit gamma [Myxococcota bacterium]MDW8280542.1 ATP synthase F1 subunit gamma [Myxococcales bacterium]